MPNKCFAKFLRTFKEQKKENLDLIPTRVNRSHKTRNKK